MADSIDLKITVIAANGESWGQRSKRLQMNTEALQQSLQPATKDNYFMDPSLREAASEASVHSFIDAVERISAEKKLCVSSIINQLGPSENSLLHMVTSSGNEEIAQLIAYHFPWLICKRNIKGDTALHIAARGGMLNTIQILVSCGKDFPSKDSSDSSSTGGHGLQRIKNVHGNTALHEAVMNRHHDVAQFLISADPQVWYYQNKEGWSPLYMAVKIGDFQIFRLLLQAPTGHSDLVNKLEGNPPAHATIIEGKIDMLEEMAKVNPELMQLKDGKRRNVLHWAAHRGNIDAVRFLSSQFKSSMFEMDNKGFLSIHIASKKGHVKVIKELLKQWPYPEELLNKEGQNILHVAATSGKNNVVKYILETPTLVKLLNEKDINGNTPLHLAAMHSHPAVVLTLTWEKKTNINLLNNESLTAFDVSPRFSNGGIRAQYNLTNGALWSVGIGRRNLDLMIHKQKRQTSKRRNSIKIEWFKERIGTFLLLQTLVATVTFAAALTVPGGYNSSEHQEKGMSTMLNKHMFRLFVICNTTAFYSSVIGIFSVLYMMISDMFLVAIVYFFSLFLFALALCMMSVAFMAAIHLGVSQVSWLGSYTLITGIISVVVMLLMFAAHSYPLGLRPRFFRYISYYFTRAVVPLLGNYAKLPLDKAKEFEHRDEIQHEGSQQVRKDVQEESLPQTQNKEENSLQLRSSIGRTKCNVI